MKKKGIYIFISVCIKIKGKIQKTNDVWNTQKSIGKKNWETFMLKKISYNQLKGGKPNFIGSKSNNESKIAASFGRSGSICSCIFLVSKFFCGIIITVAPASIADITPVTESRTQRLK